jgi:hypothetical protein
VLTLDPTKIGFDWGNARACAEAAALAYMIEPRATSEEGFPLVVISDPKTSAKCFVMDRGDCIVIGFEGSKEPEDFIHDAEFWMTPYDGDNEKVHEGFLDDFNSIRNDLVRQVNILAPAGIHIAGVYAFGCPRVGNGKFRDLYNAAGAGTKPGTRPVFVLGHSLGGSLGVLGALELSRVFDCDTGMTLGDITFDVVNQNDIVPRTPPLLMGYTRVGQKVFLFSPTGWGINPSLWMLLLSDAFGFWTAYRKKCDVLVTEHFINAYQKRMQGL